MSRQRRHDHYCEACNIGGLGHSDYSNNHYKRRCQRDQSSELLEAAEAPGREHTTFVTASEPVEINHSTQSSAQMPGELLARRSSTSQDTPISSVPCCIRGEFSDEEPDEPENEAGSQSTDASGVHKWALHFSLFQGQWQLLLRHTSWSPCCSSQMMAIRMTSWMSPKSPNVTGSFSDHTVHCIIEEEEEAFKGEWQEPRPGTARWYLVRRDQPLYAVDCC